MKATHRTRRSAAWAGGLLSLGAVLGGQTDMTHACPPGDMDGDARIDLSDHAGFAGCNSGPGVNHPGNICATADVDADLDVDLLDWSQLQALFGYDAHPVFWGWWHVPLGNDVSSYTLADFDGDGNLDTAATYHGEWGESGWVKVHLQGDDGAFVAGPAYLTAPEPTAVFAGDLDGDGDQDMVVNNRNSSHLWGSISVLLNDGQACFDARSPYFAGSNPWVSGLHDIDGDGDLDVLASSSVGLVVFHNDGGGALGAFVPLIPGGYSGPVVADFDEDGDRDLAISDSGECPGGGISIRRNHGDGTFSEPAQFAAGLSPSGLLVGDFDSDGHLDLLFNTSCTPNAIHVWRGDGTGNFMPFATTVEPQTRVVAAGDLDRDGDLDVVGAGPGYLEVSILRNSGLAVFGERSTYRVPDSVSRCVVADLDGNGFPDLNFKLSPGSAGSGVLSLRNHGDGTFDLWDTYPAGDSPFRAEAIDLDRDGDLDAAVLAFGHPDWGDGAAVVLINEGDGTFAPGVEYPVSEWAWDMAIGDVNGDASPDVAIVHAGVNLISGTVSVLLNRGDGTFGPRDEYPVGGLPGSVAMGDLDGDGNPDLLVTDAVNDALLLLLGEGNGLFSTSTVILNLPSLTSAAIADLDGDHDADIAVTSHERDEIVILLNQGDGTFAQGMDVPAGGPSLDVKVGDVSGDGHLDLIIVGGVSGDFGALIAINRGDATFHTPYLAHEIAHGAVSVALSDIDGDGDLDLGVPTGYRRRLLTFFNDGAGFFSAETMYCAGAPSYISFGDMNGDGDADAVCAGGGLFTISNRCIPGDSR